MSLSPHAATASPSSPRHVIPSDELFSRDDERRLESLRRLRSDQMNGSDVSCHDMPPNDQHPLAPEQEAELAALESKYQLFLEEGVRRLHCADALRAATVPSAKSSRPGESTATTTTTGGSATTTTTTEVPSSWTEGVVSAASTIGRAAYFWGSLVGTAVPAVAKRIGITDHFCHWNFITDRLILGALPVITQVGNLGNHLVQLRQQLDERQQKLGLVVACLGYEEMQGFGVQLVEFAQEQHWHTFISPAIEYIYLPMLDGTAEVTMEQVRAAVDRLHHILDVKKQCAYVHCKAGKGRSWMIVVCYLATYGGRTFDNAEALVCMARHQVNPSRSQREFARDFCKKFHGDELARKLMQEDVEPD